MTPLVVPANATHDSRRARRFSCSSMRPCSAEKSAGRRMMPQLLALTRRARCIAISSRYCPRPKMTCCEIRAASVRKSSHASNVGLASSIFSTSSWTMATNSVAVRMARLSEGQGVVVELPSVRPRRRAGNDRAVRCEGRELKLLDERIGEVLVGRQHSFDARAIEDEQGGAKGKPRPGPTPVFLSQTEKELDGGRSTLPADEVRPEARIGRHRAAARIPGSVT